MRLEVASHDALDCRIEHTLSLPGDCSCRGEDVLWHRATSQRSLPSWAGLAFMLPPLSATSRVMQIGVTSNQFSLTDLSMITYWTVRWRLLRVPGVANVVIWGDRFKQLQVQADPQKLRAYHV